MLDLSEIEDHVNHDLLDASAESRVAGDISLGTLCSLTKCVLEQGVDLVAVEALGTRKNLKIH